MLLFFHTTLLLTSTIFAFKSCIALKKSTASSSAHEVPANAILCYVLACQVHFAILHNVWHCKSVMIHALMWELPKVQLLVCIPNQAGRPLLV